MKMRKLAAVSLLAEFALAAPLVTGASMIGAGSAQAAGGERRIALVLGESAYRKGPLSTAANDAGLVAETLQAAGFDVVGARDLDADSMRDALRDFVQKARDSGPNTVAFVYFAGYGVQAGGENYLVPVNATIASAADASLEAVRVDDFLRPLAALPLKARIVVLDAARTGPFDGAADRLAGGLALMQPDDGELIAFNAAPGTVGPRETGAYGVYARALAEMMKTGGASLNDVFRRVRLRVDADTQGAELPWQASRIDTPFQFFARAANAPPVQGQGIARLETAPISSFDARDAYLAAVTRDTLRGYEDFLRAFPRDPLARRVRAIVAARREESVWIQAVSIGTPPAYWSYLSQYRRGPHAFEARRALGRLGASDAPPSGFSGLAFDTPPPPPDELDYVDRPYVYLADPQWGFAPAPSPPPDYLPPQADYYAAPPPPPPPTAQFVLPFPVYERGRGPDYGRRDDGGPGDRGPGDRTGERVGAAAAAAAAIALPAAVAAHALHHAPPAGQPTGDRAGESARPGRREPADATPGIPQGTPATARPGFTTGEHGLPAGASKGLSAGSSNGSPAASFKGLPAGPSNGLPAASHNGQPAAGGQPGAARGGHDGFARPVPEHPAPASHPASAPAASATHAPASSSSAPASSGSSPAGSSPTPARRELPAETPSRDVRPPSGEDAHRRRGGDSEPAGPRGFEPVSPVTRQAPGETHRERPAPARATPIAPPTHSSAPIEQPRAVDHEPARAAPAEPRQQPRQPPAAEHAPSPGPVARQPAEHGQGDHAPASHAPADHADHAPNERARDKNAVVGH